MASFLSCSTASNVADDGEDDDDSGDGETQDTQVQDSQISDEMEDSQSSIWTFLQSSNQVTTPLPSTPLRRPILGKRMRYDPKKDYIEDR